jgi:membrane-bound ClpP family serine protease
MEDPVSVSWPRPYSILGPSGKVFFHGELWQAEADGQEIR